MLDKFRTKFPANHSSGFPVLTGCDDYLRRLHGVKLDSTMMMQTTLLSADFADAFTETGIERLQHSISFIGEIIKFDFSIIDLMGKLVNLVFSNCYFYTPYGLYRQSRGMPMGDYSSRLVISIPNLRIINFINRDSLDVDLSRSEYEIISDLGNISSSVHLYCRLVDDISVVMQGDFSRVVELIRKMAEKYPKMPLNTQISFGYCRFLDLHIYNIDTSDEASLEHYSLCNVLAYKENSSFIYTPSFSNICSKYKHAIVPISLHRAHTRNTLQKDIDHHLQFIARIIRSRMQDPIEVKKKTFRFFKMKQQSKKHKVLKKSNFKNCVSVKYDDGSRRHCYMRFLIRKCFKTRLTVLYKSVSNLGSLICPKRRVIRMLSSMIDK